MGPLSLLDLAALAVFLACWFGYASIVDRVPRIRAKSVIAAMDEHRRRWMRAMVARDPRVFDGIVIGNLMSSASFLATTAIFILGGLVAMLGATEMGLRVVGTIPFAATPTEALWEIKIGLLIVIFIQAFFALTWSIRQFNYLQIIVGGVGQAADSAAYAQAEMAARVANRAAKHFNTGLRAYYFGLAALAWLIHPVALMGASLLVLAELHRREFRSVVREAMTEGRSAPGGG
ncbi:DUF599 domain-containing protein [Elioraea rosea]|uniref:DUF599 domain-containing protein n=1 Tax=Elioraea rosea TaxID=2492390 RepID=UPI00118413E7|nr:DUF599 domain-containing protein [Elioraea rosea]